MWTPEGTASKNSAGQGLFGPTMFAHKLHHHSPPRWTVRTVVPGTTIDAATGNARALLTLALAALGLITVMGDLDVPWSSVSATLLLTLLARAFFVAAQRSDDRRFSWLLSASVAAGFAMATVYDLVSAAPATWAAVLVACMALLVVRGLMRRRQALAQHGLGGTRSGPPANANHAR